jgi:glycosyltransferase involved in cell wall biosynthesis
VTARRVLFFRPSLGEGGADRVTYTVLRHLDRARFEPSIALVRRTGPFLADLPDDVEVHDLDAPSLARSTVPLARLIRRLRPDVVFSTASAANIVAVAAHRLIRSRARLVLSERNAIRRGRDARHLKQNVEVALKRVTYRFADLVTAVSQGVADELIEAVHVPAEQVSVVYNPMVDDDLAARAAEPVNHPWFAARDTEPVVLACARLVPQKDYRTLLDAFARVRAARPARLFVLGEGPERPALEQRARELGLAEQVCFHGFDKNPFKYMSRARLLMHASRAEGLPGSLIQTMACGAPVVSTDCDFGPREVIADGVDGYLVPVGDAAALADRALRLLADDGLRARMAQVARASAQRFTTAASMARYEAAIEGSGS